MVAGGSSDQVACVHPHKPQLAEIGFFQQFQNGVDVILSCHDAAPPTAVVLFAHIIQLFAVSCKQYYLRKNRMKNWIFSNEKGGMFNGKLFYLRREDGNL